MDIASMTSEWTNDVIARSTPLASFLLSARAGKRWARARFPASLIHSLNAESGRVSERADNQQLQRATVTTVMSSYSNYSENLVATAL